jgi:hypothetical protein
MPLAAGRSAGDDSETERLLSGLRSGPSSPSGRGSETPSPPTEEADLEPDVALTSAESGPGGASADPDEEEGEEEEAPEWADPEFIAMHAPSRRTRGGVARTEAESRGSALRTRRAVGVPDKADAAAATRSGAAGSSTAPPPGSIRKVLIVGAGYAGISAARTLTDMGYSVRAHHHRHHRAAHAARRRCPLRHTRTRAHARAGCMRPHASRARSPPTTHPAPPTSHRPLGLS